MGSNLLLGSLSISDPTEEIPTYETASGAWIAQDNTRNHETVTEVIEQSKKLYNSYTIHTIFLIKRAISQRFVRIPGRLAHRRVQPVLRRENLPNSLMALIKITSTIFAADIFLFATYENCASLSRLLRLKSKCNNEVEYVHFRWDSLYRENSIWIKGIFLFFFFPSVFQFNT